MGNLLVSNGALPAIRSGERSFFENVPIEWIMNTFEEAFKSVSSIKSVHDPLTLQQLVMVFQRVYEQTRDHLHSGDFSYVIRYMVDQIEENFGWEYNAFILDVPVVFNIQTAFLNQKEAEVTVENCLRGIYMNLLQAQKHVAQFNKLPALKIRPLIPKLNVGSCMDYVMDHVMEVMRWEHDGKKEMKNSHFSSRVISEGFKRAQMFELVPGANLCFDVFDVTHAGWAYVRLAVQFKALGIRFVVVEDEVGFANQKLGSEIPPIVLGFLERAASSIKHWNWLVEGGHSKLKRSITIPRSGSPWG